MKRTIIKAGAAMSLVLAIALSEATISNADQPINTAALRAVVDADGIMEHLDALQAIANDSGGTRYDDTPGFEKSVEYVEQTLLTAGYTVSIQEFSYELGVVDSAVMKQTAPGTEEYVYLEDFFEMQYTPDGTADADVTAVDVNLDGDRASDSGCEAAEIAGREQIVGVQEQRKLAAQVGKGGVPRRASAAVWLAMDRDRAAIAGEDRGCCVGRAVVDDDQFERGAFLSEHAVDRVGDEWLAVVDGDDDTNER